MCHCPCATRCIDDGVRVLEGEAQRLLNEYVLARLERIDRDLGLRVAVAEQYRIDVRVQDVPVIGYVSGHTEPVGDVLRQGRRNVADHIDLVLLRELSKERQMLDLGYRAAAYDAYPHSFH